RAGPGAAWTRGARRPALHGSGGPRHRPAQQAEGLRAAGERSRHRRGEPRARLPAGRAGLGNRQPDPRRPRPDHDPDPHQQSEEDQRARGLRPDGRGAGSDRGAAQRGEPPLPRGQAEQARPQAAPPGSALRRAGAARVTDERWPGEDRLAGTKADEEPEAESQEAELGPEVPEQEADVAPGEEELAEAEAEPAPPEEQLRAEEV